MITAQYVGQADSDRKENVEKAAKKAEKEKQAEERKQV